ncbi:YhgE/Pip domain-containing protein [Kitasatospora sp. NPDC059646]|uniref:YhgE/Pip domain-containing protein n=1 Tax=Kitasatospora sp. NPDC059646 TaxID=3346893 RepID=UPI0036D0F3E6
MSQPTPAHTTSARGLLRRRSLWIPSAVILGLLSFVLSLLYLGANNDPVGSMKDLPIAVVNEDRGAQAADRRIDLGTQITAQITGSAELEGKVAWKQVDRRTADELMADDKVFGALVVPDDFSASVAALAGPLQPGAHPPTVTVLTNPAAGSFGSTMASEINQQVVRSVSTRLGERLTQQLAQQAAQHPAQQAGPPAAAGLMLDDPIRTTVRTGHPLGDHSGLGMSAFFYTLVLVLGGMLGANVIHAQLDTALGWLANDKGPFRSLKPAQHLSRVGHFAVGSVLMVALSMLTSALALAAAAGVIGIDAPHLPMLWLFGTCATAAMGITALALLAAFGTPGPIVSMLILIGLAVPSAGGTVPLQALPSFYRFLGEFEPFRQVVDGVRAILYFDARTGAGLGRAWTMVGLGFALSVALGLLVTRLYDRRGLHRSAPLTPAAQAIG